LPSAAATTPPITVLGVDPGLTRCGLGIVAGPSSRPTLVHLLCVRTGAEQPLEQRLLAVHDAVLALIEEYRPDAVAVERVLFSSNVRTAMSTGQAAGVALLAAGRAGLPVTPYSPTEIKLTVAGSGAADKDAVGRLVAAQLGLAEVPRPADVADALAVALTHLARSRMAAAAVGTPAAAMLQEAGRAAGRTQKQGWEAVIRDRGLREAVPATQPATQPATRPVTSPRIDRPGGRP
jgi:crossover junction endodeoxyribonuclease RuvC